MASAKDDVPNMADASSLTAENFEKELKELARNAKQQTFTNRALKQLDTLLQASAVLILAAFASNAALLSLSPTYGAIPSSIYHAPITYSALFFGWSSSLFLQRHLPRSPTRFLPVLAFSIPAIQSILSPLSSILGPIYGSILSLLVTIFPLLVLSAAGTALVLDNLSLSNLRMPQPITDAAPGFGAFVLYRTFESLSSTFINRFIGRSFFLTRVGLQMLVGGLYALRFPSSLLAFALPAILNTAFVNVHVQSSAALARLNAQLEPTGWEVLARADSITGYVSVMESRKEGYRVMRCDHSLLGGEWIPGVGPHARGLVKGFVGEPIYAIFAMLEAVRLIDVPFTIKDRDASALVIGLGIGTTPSALIAHGIKTTIVEIDPVVHEYATKYFSLPKKHIPVIADAVTYAAQLANSSPAKFDYIVHDVFTGGAEPVDLFTMEFLADLHSLLKPNGVIAINYAGDLLFPSSALIVRTIKATFPSCRIYRENAAPDAETLARDKQDFTNMVIFCRKTTAQVTFRKPVARDLLSSPARRMYLMPKFEIGWDGVGFEGMENVGGVEAVGQVLWRNGTEVLRKAQSKSAVGHWEVMRTVIDARIWEMW